MAPVGTRWSMLMSCQEFDEAMRRVCHSADSQSICGAFERFSGCACMRMMLLEPIERYVWQKRYARLLRPRQSSQVCDMHLSRD